MGLLDLVDESLSYLGMDGYFTMASRTDVRDFVVLGSHHRAAVNTDFRSEFEPLRVTPLKEVDEALHVGRSVQTLRLRAMSDHRVLNLTGLQVQQASYSIEIVLRAPDQQLTTSFEEGFVGFPNWIDHQGRSENKRPPGLIFDGFRSF